MLQITIGKYSPALRLLGTLTLWYVPANGAVSVVTRQSNSTLPLGFTPDIVLQPVWLGDLDLYVCKYIHPSGT